MIIKASVRYTINNLKLAQDSDHPNKLPFSGTLLVLDEISDRAPHGSNGHKIYVPSSVAQSRLSTLIGMPLNYNGDLSDHDSQNVVGVITSAWIEENKVEVQGYVWKKTFPEAEDALHGKRLGMSMELADVAVEDKDAPVWRLEDFYFTGATALWPESAAYQRTALAAAAADDHGTEGGSMPDDKKKKAAQPSKALVDVIAASVATAIQAALAPMVTSITELRQDIAKIPSTINAAGKTETEEEKLVRELNELSAGAEDEGEEDLDAAGDEDDEDDDIDAADDKKDKKKKKDEGDDEPDADDEEMDSGGDSDQGDITNQNQDAKNKGNKTSMTASASTIEAMKAAKGTMVTLRTRIKKIETLLASERKTRKSEKKRLDAIEGQLEASAAHQSRRTLTPELAGLLEKNGIDMNASGAKKLSLSFVDKMFDTCGFQIEPHMRMAFKNQLRSAGFIESERTM